MSAYRVESRRIEQPDDVRQDWLDVQDRADCSYFLSWGWIGTWLAQIARGLRPLAVRVSLDNRPVGLGLFVARDINRHLIIHSRALFLNEYPFDGRNMVIEYNGILAVRGHEKAVMTQVLDHLLGDCPGYDEFIFGAIAEGPASDSLMTHPLPGANAIVRDESVCWSVRLDAATRDVGACLAGLSRNRRTQVRRAMRLYEQAGPLRIEAAGNVDQAQRFFDRLKALHTHRWRAVGRQGSFENPDWERFHRALIRDRFATDEIQLLKVRAGDHEIGYLYNFRWRDRVYVLQTGFAASADKRLMPGYVAHVLAIVFNSNEGMRLYDLMHGDELYKRLLCNRQQKLVWVVVQRRRVKFVFENAAARISGMLRRGSSG